MQPIIGELVEMMQKVRPWYFKYCKVLQDNMSWGSYHVILIELYQALALRGCFSHAVQRTCCSLPYYVFHILTSRFA